MNGGDGVIIFCQLRKKWSNVPCADYCGSLLFSVLSGFAYLLFLKMHATLRDVQRTVGFVLHYDDNDYTPTDVRRRRRVDVPIDDMTV